MGNFLTQLQDSLENGKFNSEIANKINSLSEAADDKLAELGVDGIIKSISDKVDSEENHVITQEDVDAAQKANDAFLAKNLKLDLMNKRIAEIMQMEHLIDDSINDILTHVDEVKEFYMNDDAFKPLLDTLNNVIKKYSSVNISEVSTIIDIPQLDINGNKLA